MALSPASLPLSASTWNAHTPHFLVCSRSGLSVYALGCIFFFTYALLVTGSVANKGHFQARQNTAAVGFIQLRRYLLNYMVCWVPISVVAIVFLILQTTSRAMKICISIAQAFFLSQGLLNAITFRLSIENVDRLAERTSAFCGDCLFPW